MAREVSGTVAVVGCLGLIPAILIGWMLRAWAIITLWGWFIYPTWHIVAPSNQAAVGIAILMSLFVSCESSGGGDKDQSAGAKMAIAYLKMLGGPPMAVLAGWCVRHWL